MKTLLVYALLFFSSSFLLAQKQHYKQEENTHRIITYNIRNAKGLDNKTDYKRIADIIESTDPDIVSLQELDSVTTRSNAVDVLKEIADITRMHYTYAPSISFQGGKYGIGLLSKKRPISSRHIPLPGKEEARILSIVEFENYFIFNTHLSLKEDDRLKSIEIISKQAELCNKPIILTGDLNCEPNSEEIKILSQKWKIINNQKVPTFPADKPNITIDYIAGYMAKGEVYSVHQNHVLNEPVASDHRPILADIRLKAPAEKVMKTMPYLQNPSTDEMTVMWSTNVPCRSWVEYGTDTLNMKRARSFVEGEMMANNTINRIKLENLQPDTQYYYRVVSQEITLFQPYHKEFGDTIKSPTYSFKTWGNQQKDFTAVIFNDIHDNYKLFDKLCDQIKNIDYDIVFFNGDCIADVQSEENAVRSISHYTQKMNGSNIPTIFIRGNHETRGAYSMYLWNLLGKVGAEHSYGGFNIGDTRFTLLDCGEDKPDNHREYSDMNDFTQYRLDQVEFLKKEINSREFKKANKRVLIHHIPIYCKDLEDYHPCKDLWEPILSKTKFNISLNAHHHRFEYIPVGKLGNNYPVVIGGGSNEKSGTVSIIEKKGDKMTFNILNVNGESLLKLDL
ncbi:endonuclease/exonuclease/phosphatase family protein [Dysgonomonas sp. Marseille-P4361]|uniref:endonuclease/exonuclease/phosphatase family protein n=1 Tax=Dysgonomonas sp. Marseille-P4361 TaxID=2161820 RepID=UPI000D562154|nr:endonuclease/exonuclease/phosphatase family protein [Dysgonomonas sp. Marseille-P4361]